MEASNLRPHGHSLIVRILCVNLGVEREVVERCLFRVQGLEWFELHDFVWGPLADPQLIMCEACTPLWNQYCQVIVLLACRGSFVNSVSREGGVQRSRHLSLRVRLSSLSSCTRTVVALLILYLPILPLPQSLASGVRWLLFALVPDPLLRPGSPLRLADVAPPVHPAAGLALEACVLEAVGSAESGEGAR